MLSYFDSLALRERRGTARLRGDLSRLGIEVLGKELSRQVGGCFREDAGARKMLLAKRNKNNLQKLASPRSRERGPIEAGFRSREIRAAEPHLIGEAAADLPPPRLRRTDKAAALHSTA